MRTWADNQDELLQPYQEVIDRLNRENGWRLAFPEGSQQDIYNYYKDMSPEAFEKIMREEMEKIMESVQE